MPTSNDDDPKRLDEREIFAQITAGLADLGERGEAAFSRHQRRSRHREGIARLRRRLDSVVLLTVVITVALAGTAVLGGDSLPASLDGIGKGASSPDGDPRVFAAAGTKDPRPLEAPAIVEAGGTYAYIATKRDGEPVGFNPCRPIEYEINPQGAPPGGEASVHAGVDSVSRHTGLQFRYIGTTTSRPGDLATWRSTRSNPYPPVQIVWSTAGEDPMLENAAGYARNEYLRDESGFVTSWFLTGSVVLDSGAGASMNIEHRHALRSRVIRHELGHLVGLQHVNGPDEVMRASGQARMEWGPGDREGLARLGNIPCR